MIGAVHFASEPRIIGMHQWRVIVTDSKFGGRRFTYQFAALGQLPLWAEMQAFPTFAANIPRMGLPADLALLYDDNAAAIKAAMDDDRGTWAALLSA